MADADSGTDDSYNEPIKESEFGDSVDSLIAKVAPYDESLAEKVTSLAKRNSELEGELAEVKERADDLESRLKRTHADFQNFKKRAKKKEEDIKERATEDLVERMLDVRDNLLRALEQEANADIRDGVAATLTTFDRVLEDENVTPIEPSPGEEPDPEYHEIVMTVNGEEAPGTIEEVYRPGYELSGMVLRPAQVTVSDEE